MTQEQAAELVGTRPQAITQARLIREWVPEEVAALKAGTQNLEQAHKHALEKKRQTENPAPRKRKKKKKTDDPAQDQMAFKSGPAAESETATPAIATRQADSAESEKSLDNSRDVPQDRMAFESGAVAATPQDSGEQPTRPALQEQESIVRQRAEIVLSLLRNLRDNPQDYDGAAFADFALESDLTTLEPFRKFFGTFFIRLQQRFPDVNGPAKK